MIKPLQKLKGVIADRKNAIASAIAEKVSLAKEKISFARRFAIDRYADAKRISAEYWRVALLPEHSRFFAAAAYIPFVGWLAPMYLKEDAPFCQESAKQGFVLAVFFAAVPIVLSLIGILFIPKDLRIINLILVILVYLSNATYFVLCIAGAFMAIRSERQLIVPVAASYAQQLRL